MVKYIMSDDKLISILLWKFEFIQVCKAVSEMALRKFIPLFPCFPQEFSRNIEAVKIITKTHLIKLPLDQPVGTTQDETAVQRPRDIVILKP